ncbi:MAG: NUDIX hydrolase [Christensenellales bacterium]|jgi:ADP-ribose pyrophosphatase|nr:NUDIX hydrolase [Clostridiales bacterium]
MQNLREKVLTKQTEFEGKIITVQQWKVALPDGREAGREIVLHNGAAAVVPVDKQNRVTLVRQHRVAIDQVTLEIPAGKLDDPKEDPFLCAKRELEEETGLLAGKWQKMAHVVTTPGFCTERIALYLATDLTQAKAHTDPDEFLSLVKMPLTEAIMMVEKGQIVDAKTCLGLLLAQQILNQPAFLWQDNMTQMKPGMKDYYPKADGC